MLPRGELIALWRVIDFRMSFRIIYKQSVYLFSVVVVETIRTTQLGVDTGQWTIRARLPFPSRLFSVESLLLLLAVLRMKSVHASVAPECSHISKCPLEFREGDGWRIDVTLIVGFSCHLFT